MPAYNILGITVHFPYDAYMEQLKYMEKVILSLQKNQNALLESPTGTGKTLSLLCATLAWRENESQRIKAADLDGPHSDMSNYGAHNQTGQPASIQKPPQIIYASRTHSQLSQVAHELSKTVYKKTTRTCMLGSRHQLCVHPTVHAQKGSNINRMCRQKVQSKTCSYHASVQDMKGVFPQVEDIESFRAWGQENQTCPYFLSKEQKTDADIIFMPYNYVLDPLIRKTLGLDLTGSVIILDEAHNVESVAADCGSFEITSLDLQGCIEEITKCLDVYGIGTVPLPPPVAPEAPDLASNLPINLDDINKLVVSNSGGLKLSAGSSSNAPVLWNFSTLKDTIVKLKELIDTMSIPNDGVTYKGDYIYQLFGKVNITHETKAVVLQLIETAADLLSNDTNLVRTFRTVSYLSNLSEVLRKLFMDDTGSIRGVAEHYKVHVQDDKRPNSGPGQYFQAKAAVRRVSFWCFNAGIIMQDLAKSGVRNFILTSGTLSPLDSFAYELSLDFPMESRLESTHVIDTRQIWVGAASKAPSGERLLGTYSARTDSYLKSLAMTIVNICRVTPDGVLVFFPSYTVLESCMKAWNEPNSIAGGDSATYWESITRCKQAVVEPRESNKLQLAMDDYVGKIKATLGETPIAGGGPKGAVFFAVSRGKVSEGLDFADENGRAVIIVGIPFPNAQDARIQLKKIYLNDMKEKLRQSALTTNSGVAISGEEWYRQSAWRAINQAVGRVIRHKFDFGAIVLADERFAHEAPKHLSKWLRSLVKTFDNFGQFQHSLSAFFTSIKGNPPSKQMRLPGGAAKSGAAPSVVEGFHQSNSKSATARQLLDSIDQGEKMEAAKKAAASSTSSNPAQSTAAKEAKKKEMMQQRSKEYLVSVKKLFTAEEYQKFQDMMRSYREKLISVSQLMETHLDLLGSDPKRDELRQNFTVFLPAENRPEWLEKVSGRITAVEKAPVRPAEAPKQSLPPSAPVSLPQKKIDRSIPQPVKFETPKNMFVPPQPAVAPPIESDAIEDIDDDDQDIFESVMKSAASRPKPTFRAPRVNETPIPRSVVPPPPPAAAPRPISASAAFAVTAPQDDDAIMILDDDDDRTGMAAASANPGSTGSDWIKSMNRKKAHAHPSTATGVPVDDTSPEPPLKKMKRTNSIDLITGQELDKPPIGLSSPLGSKSSAAAAAFAPQFSAAVPASALVNLTPEPDASSQPTPGRTECPVCRSSQGIFENAPCGHVCCHTCWERILTVKQECPICRQRTRMKQLRKVIMMN